MKHSQGVDKLAKFLAYVLGRRPDEFGLVPDADGYVKIKDLLKALAEEPGWRHVRMNHLREVIYAGRSQPIELAAPLIRAVDRSSLPVPQSSADFPKLLYHAIRRRAYPFVLESGRPPDAAGSRLILTADEPFALRLGRRIDQTPVVLVVHSAKVLSSGARLWRFGQRLFLLDRLPVDCFSGPHPPKQRPEPKKSDKTAAREAPATPGSYLLDLSDSPAPENRFNNPSRQRKNAWKRDRKRKQRR